MPEQKPGKSASDILPIRGENLRVVRDGRILLNIDEIQLGRPGITTILGHNGAGKSLLLKVLTGLVQPDTGIFHWAGRPLQRVDYRRLGYMKQNAVLLRRSAKANLEFVLKLSGHDGAGAGQKADMILEQFDLQRIRDTSARLLSGGEKQRLALARMLAGEPEILLLDEPTASLDPISTKAIESVIVELKKTGKPIVLVTHDLNQARRLSDDIIFLDQARMLAHQSASSFFSAPPCVEASDFLGL